MNTIKIFNMVRQTQNTIHKVDHMETDTCRQHVHHGQAFPKEKFSRRLLGKMRKWQQCAITCLVYIFSDYAADCEAVHASPHGLPSLSLRQRQEWRRPGSQLGLQLQEASQPASSIRPVARRTALWVSTSKAKPRSCQVFLRKLATQHSQFQLLSIPSVDEMRTGQGQYSKQKYDSKQSLLMPGPCATTVEH